VTSHAEEGIKSSASHFPVVRLRAEAVSGAVAFLRERLADAVELALGTKMTEVRQMMADLIAWLDMFVDRR